MSHKIFVFEFISGGGFNKENIPPSLFCEGFGMLRSVIDDFQKLDNHIITLLDNRIQFLSPLLKANSIESVKPSDKFSELYKSRVKECDFCFIIAPEFSNILLDLTQIIKRYNKELLSVDLDGIKIASSKYKTYEYFLSHDLKTPETFLIPLKNGLPDADFIRKRYKDLDSHVIIKPDDGVGAESIFKIESEKDLDELLRNLNSHFEKGRRYIIQNYIYGKPLSLSLFNSFPKRKKPLLISINSQNIFLKNKDKDSEYLGGYTPIQNYEIVEEKINQILEKVKFPEFYSLYGIDFIMDNNSIFFIEINPRLTTSYIGLRNTLLDNPLKLLINDKEFNKDVIKKNEFISIFKRIELKYEGKKSFDELNGTLVPLIMKKFPEFITPPINFNKKSRIYSCFIATKERSLIDSKKRIILIESFLNKKEFEIRRMQTR